MPALDGEPADSLVMPGVPGYQRQTIDQCGRRNQDIGVRDKFSTLVEARVNLGGGLYYLIAERENAAYPALRVESTYLF